MLLLSINRKKSGQWELSFVPGTFPQNKAKIGPRVFHKAQTKSLCLAKFGNERETPKLPVYQPNQRFPFKLQSTEPQTTPLLLLMMELPLPPPPSITSPYISHFFTYLPTEPHVCHSQCLLSISLLLIFVSLLVQTELT
ncbi:hypothetical protein FRX31_005543 [Thalictrum thalictroides]|uniref:Uncharacterized protein n=1 Tax=Thalictrum thalictroides TaxID=46969 RepID=A0A7J6X7J7_THATH|nr:hypothetical protein FRX31_005543 [Thalictrum thalictroides]